MTIGTISVRPSKAMELVDITPQLSAHLRESGVSQGICILFNPHTTAGLTINEGADPEVRTDIIEGLRKMVPLNHPFRHLEGNSPAHIMASLMGSSLTVAVDQARFQLGTWQKIFFCEFDGPRTRSVHYPLLEAR